MSELKQYELEVSATSFDGSQTFACWAKDEAEAEEKFKRGECYIIDVNIEVLGLEREPFSIEESFDISSRLPGDVITLLETKLTTITKQRDELEGTMESIREYASMIPIHLTDEDNHSNRHIKHFVEQIIALSTINEQKGSN